MSRRYPEDHLFISTEIRVNLSPCQRPRRQPRARHGAQLRGAHGDTAGEALVQEDHLGLRDGAQLRSAHGNVAGEAVDQKDHPHGRVGVAIGAGGGGEVAVAAGDGKGQLLALREEMDRCA